MRGKGFIGYYVPMLLLVEEELEDYNYNKRLGKE